MDKVKAILSSSPVLAFYDANKPLRLTADGSRKGIGDWRRPESRRWKQRGANYFHI
jgi:hypothetical protein